MPLRKMGETFFKFALEREGYPERVEFPQKRGGSNPGGNYDSNMFLLINLQNIKTCPKKVLQQGLFVLISLCYFRQVLSAT